MMTTKMNREEKKQTVVTSLGFSAVMTIISLAMLVKSFVVADRAEYARGIFDLAIWAVMAVTWVAALVLRLRQPMSRRRSDS